MTPLIHDSKKRVKTEHKGKLLHSVVKFLGECQCFERAEKKAGVSQQGRKMTNGKQQQLVLQNTKY